MLAERRRTGADPGDAGAGRGGHRALALALRQRRPPSGDGGTRQLGPRGRLPREPDRARRPATARCPPSS